MENSPAHMIYLKKIYFISFIFSNNNNYDYGKKVAFQKKEKRKTKGFSLYLSIKKLETTTLSDKTNVGEK